MADDPSLKINIGVRSDTKGVTEAAAAVDKVKESTKQATGTIEEFGKRGSEAKDAFEGLRGAAQGGEGAIFNLSKAWRALTVAFTANPITAALAVVLGLLPLIKKGVDAIVKSVTDMSESYAHAGQQAELLKQKNEEFEASAKKGLAAISRAVDALNADYAGLIGLIDRAEKRQRELNNAQKELALARAKTPEERSAVEDRFSSIELSESAKFAREKKVAATTTRRELVNQLVTAEKSEATAEAAMKDALDSVRELGARTDAEALELRGLALAARKAYEGARTNAEETRKKISPQVERLDAEIFDAETTLQKTPILRRAQEVRTSTKVSSSSGDIKALQRKAADLGTAYSLAGARDFERGASHSGPSEETLKVKAELDAANAALSAANAAVRKFAKETAADSKATATALDRQSSQIKNNRR